METSGDLGVPIFLNNSVLYMARLRDIDGTSIKNLNGRGVFVHLGTGRGNNVDCEFEGFKMCREEKPTGYH
jgi:hypothetical protein